MLVLGSVISAKHQEILQLLKKPIALRRIKHGSGGTLEFHTDDILRDRNSFVLLTRLTSLSTMDGYLPMCATCICGKENFMHILMINIYILHPYQSLQGVGAGNDVTESQRNPSPLQKILYTHNAK